MGSPTIQSRKRTRPLSCSEAVGIHVPGGRPGENPGSRSRRRNTDRLQRSRSGNSSNFHRGMLQAKGRGASEILVTPSFKNWNFEDGLKDLYLESVLRMVPSRRRKSGLNRSTTYRE